MNSSISSFVKRKNLNYPNYFSVHVLVKECIEEPTSKINVFLQAYISQLNLKVSHLFLIWFMLHSQQVEFFEQCLIFLKRDWSQLFRRALDLCKMVEKRMW